MNFKKLENNLLDMIQEQQVKIGYMSGVTRFYYPLQSLNRLLGTELTEEEMQHALEEFSDHACDRLGKVKASSKNERRAADAGTCFFVLFFQHVYHKRCRTSDVCAVCVHNPAEMPPGAADCDSVCAADACSESGEHADADRKSAESISLQHLRCRAG